MERAQDVWNTILYSLYNSYDSSDLDEYFEDSKKVTDELNGLITILVPTTYIQKQLNTLYMNSINKIINEKFDGNYRIKFVTREDYEKKEQIIIEKEAVSKQFESNLNNSYTFSSFMVGESNRFAHRQALLVSQQSAEIGNPFYIFGSVGIGKTHLMQAIGNAMLDTNIKLKVLYIQTQDFINEFSKASQSKKIDELYDKYTDLDLLLVDDIQMMSDAPKTQDFFFNIFNKLRDNNKQIVITSDCPANKLKIMDRLRSRFAWGLQADIDIPNLDLKVKILRRKLQESSSNDKNIDDEILTYIASLFQNIRDLEGCLRRVLAFATVTQEDITMDLVKESLKNLIQSKNIDSNLEKYDNLKSIVASFYNITIEDLVGKSRTNNIIVPRHLCMYILKNKYKLPYKKIGDLMGKKDHSTVMTACAKVEQELKDDEEIKLAYNTIIKKLD